MKYRVSIIGRLDEPVAHMSDVEGVSHVVERHQQVFVRNLAQEIDKLKLVYTECLDQVQVFKEPYEAVQKNGSVVFEILHV